MTHCVCSSGNPLDYEGPLVYCDEHGQPSKAYDAGYEAGFIAAKEDAITDEGRNNAARYLYRLNAPFGEDTNAWQNANDERKAIYLRGADEIAKLYMRWDK